MYAKIFVSFILQLFAINFVIFCLGGGGGWSLFLPRHLPTPSTHDLYPLPTTFSYTPKTEALQVRVRVRVRVRLGKSSLVRVKVEPRPTSLLSSSLFVLPLFYFRD